MSIALVGDASVHPVDARIGAGAKI